MWTRADIDALNFDSNDYRVFSPADRAAETQSGNRVHVNITELVSTSRAEAR
jgi:hypothetical protein